MTEHNETHPADLAGAYALHALDAQDTAAFEAHLADSERARIEAAELNDTAVALGLAVAPVQPSSALKTNLMSLLASTPQLPPLPRAAATTDAPASAPGAAAVVSPVAAAPTGPSTPSAMPGDGASTGTAPTGASRPVAGIRSADSSGAGRSSATERAQARWFKRPAQFMLAAAAAAALFVGGTFLGQTLNGNQFESQQAASLAQINAADDSQRAATTTADGQEATLVWSNKLGISALLVDNLPVLPSDQDYQLWYINGEGAVSAGTFDSSGDGTAWRVLDGTMHAGDQVGVTVEPNGGSDQPTTNPIVAFQS
ncbi:anti-sigma factor [Cryobacterium sp. TMT1-3]|uniref:Regulator of SigK n=1 Tax=Cryobacterium luteum TaxID=1424661 RepID=A0A1H8G6U0_9MICO|nr:MULTISPECIES: anti-sigma factor [Cryobacterium]TFB93879.1 anti-sigma factor [Cryobacterium luteum]TFC29992.1 anti-sigma factor [Cryobacterium sp. TMT1-3]SEN39589.1 Anti-sigma-K factor rskA [Cryobacterium luteum]